MKIIFQYTKQEYARACWMHTKRVLSPKLDAVMFSIGLIGTGWLLWAGEVLGGILSLGFLGIFTLFLLAARFIIPYYVYNNYILHRGEYYLEFTDEGIHFKAVNIDSILNWAIYQYVLSGREHYLLYYGGKNQYTIIPKRVFDSRPQLEAFETLLRHKIKDYRDV
jgi:hypothetical protein